MKIIVKMEDCKPVLFFPEEQNDDKTIQCFSTTDGHAPANRAYMRSLKAPQTKDELLRAFLVLARYAKNSAYAVMK